MRVAKFYLQRKYALVAGGAFQARRMLVRPRGGISATEGNDTEVCLFPLPLSVFDRLDITRRTADFTATADSSTAATTATATIVDVDAPNAWHAHGDHGDSAARSGIRAAHRAS